MYSYLNRKIDPMMHPGRIVSFIKRFDSPSAKDRNNLFFPKISRKGTDLTQSVAFL